MPEVPQNISRDDLLRAIEEIREHGVPAGAHSSTYDVVHEGERFPPKLVVSIANRFANGEDLDRQSFRGGLDTDAFQLLEREGFKPVPKRDEFESGFEALKKHFLAQLPEFTSFLDDKTYFEQERQYKDELVSLFDSEVRPHLDQQDWEHVGEKVISLFTRPLDGNNHKPQNIVGWRYFEPIRKLESERLGEFGRSVAELIDEEMPLEQRIEQFMRTYEQIAKGASYPIGATSRSVISFIMTLANPKSYFFLKTTEISKAIKFFDPEFRWDRQGLTADELREFETLGNRVFDRLENEDWNPRDLIDVQSFFWIATYWDEEFPPIVDPEPIPVTSKKVHERMPEPLNQILYGPPGTGKTYNTVNKALKILDPEFVANNGSDRTALKQRFEQLREKGRIGTVTFHQSFSYEDFVEGLRASADEDGQIQYEIEPGIFKRMCDAAKAKATIHTDKAIDLAGRQVWKMSLGNTQGSDSYVYDDCISNNYILLGYGRGLDYSEASSRADIERLHKESGADIDEHSYSVTATNLFVNYMKPGDLVVVSDGNFKFRAIAEVTGDYRFLADREIDDYRQAREVNWLRVYSPSLPREQLMNNAFSQMTLYQLKPNSIDMERLADLLASGDSQSSSASAVTFSVGQVFGRGYTVRETTPDILRLTKPNGRKLGFDMEMLNELAHLVRTGEITIQDIAEEKVFEKTDVDLEKYLLHGYSNIMPQLIEHLAGSSVVPGTRSSTHTDSWVLIIDEINRGNIANIFGELITLIEPTKREGAPESTEVTLPYSKEPFSVPNNLFIVGTMNTADRSLVHMDTALRRRFTFEAMMPSTQVLSAQGIEEIEGVNIVAMLEVMNQRIELLYDREHTLGHSFFLPLAETPTIGCLADIFDRQILPLLEEYFFEDWSRIRQVLGDDQKTDESTCFVVPVHTESSIQKILAADVPQELMNRAYERKDVAFLNPESYRLIYERDEA